MNDDNDLVDITCKCGKRFKITRKELRQANDTDMTIRCSEYYKTKMADLVLLVVQHLVQKNRNESAVTRTDVVMACWKLRPMRFGLEGHTYTHPDSKRVDCELVRLVGAGLLMRPEPNMFKVTADGWKETRLTECMRSDLCQKLRGLLKVRLHKK